MAKYCCTRAPNLRYGSAIRRLFEKRSPQLSRDVTGPGGPPEGGIAVRSRLGRDLSEILDGARQPSPSGGGLHHLFGTPRTPTPGIRRFMVDVASAAIGDVFGAEAVVLARRDDRTAIPVVSARLPPSWDDSSGLKFELFGRLWPILDDGRSTSEASELASGSAWFGCHRSDRGQLAAALVRPEPLTTADCVALARVVRSVAGAVGDEPAGLPPGTQLDITRSDNGPSGGVRADLALRGRGGERRASADGATEALAVARAALVVADGTGSIDATFAGTAGIDGATVAIVVLERPGDAPSIGLVVSATDPAEAVASAVFSAMVN